jgi:hypothetical protein
LITLILILLLIWFVLTVVLAAWTLFYQGYIYTEPATGIEWRAPAAGSALAAVIMLWVFLDYRNPGAYRPLNEFAATEEQKPFLELRIPTSSGDQEIFKLRRGPGGLEYVLDGRSDGKRLGGLQPEKVIAVRGEETLTFERQPPDTPGWLSLRRAETPRYLARDANGRKLVMQADSPGRSSIFRGGRLFSNLLLNLLFLTAWFLCLWLVLRFQWPAALGQAIVFWIVVSLFVLPPVLTRAEKVAHDRAAATQP